MAGRWFRYFTFLGLLVFWVKTKNYDASKESVFPVPNGTDPELLVSKTLLDQAVNCPVSVADAKEVVLLVHGTGMTAQINWDSTLLAPLVHQGFQPCYVEIPARLFHDGQVSAEYISYAVKKLSQEHPAASNGLSIISWSAGALVTQWTLTFYPETRAKVKRHVALAPSYRGSWTMLPLFYFNLYSESVVQQLPWSNFVAALLSFGGGMAHVPTTSIGSSTDQVVQPSFWGQGLSGHKDAWRLDGARAANIDLFKLCTPQLFRERSLPRVFLHESLLWEPASHKIIFDALNNEDTRLGSADVVSVEDCRGGVAPHLEPESESEHTKIMPELFIFGPTMPTSGWPEVPLREFADNHQMSKSREIPDGNDEL
ncbi:putative lipase [Xylariales sp. PMI_506]|nr:putative lipase [Xylariales sp. PMI_506]